MSPRPAWEVICGDCLSVMRTMEAGSFDAVVTDPPYGVEGGRGGRARKYGKAKYRTVGWEDTPWYIRSHVVPVIQGVVEEGKRMAVTPGIRCIHLYPQAADMGCFWTPAAVGCGPWGFTTFQPILYYGRDYRAGYGSWPTGKQVTERACGEGHPCAKPLKAWTWLLKKVSKAGEIVLDPFCGSGTTGVAAIKTGRNFVGIEINPEYCEIARKRIAAAEADVASHLFAEGGTDVA